MKNGIAKHLLGDVYQVGGKGLTHEEDASSYLIIDNKNHQHMMIDCGSPKGVFELNKRFYELGIVIGEIATVLATHGHYDHVAAAYRMPEAELFLHEGDYEAVKSRDRDMTAAFHYGVEFPELDNIRIIEDEQTFQVGNTLVKALHTPGHTAGSVSYKVQTEDGVLLVAGDTMWGGFSERFGSDASLWKESLRKLQRINFDRYTFGHNVLRAVPHVQIEIANALEQFHPPTNGEDSYDIVNPWKPLTDTPEPAL